MTVLGLFLGSVGTDLETGSERFTFGMTELDDGIELIALALGLFGIAEFMSSVNQVAPIDTANTPMSASRTCGRPRPSLKRAFFPMLRGTIIGSLCALIPGTGPTIASFVAYATEKKISKTPEKFGTGMIEGVACPEAATHSSVQGDFIPTMSLGIPGDAVMALLLGALMIQGIVPGPQLISQHPDIFWGLVASFWIGNIMLVLLNVPMIGIWVKMLAIPYKYLYPSAMFFVCIGVYAANNDFFQVGEVVVIGAFGYHPAAARLPSGADPARLRARAAVRGEFPPRHADLARRHRRVRRAADQRRLRRAVRDPDRLADLFPAARHETADRTVAAAARRRRRRPITAEHAHSRGIIDATESAPQPSSTALAATTAPEHARQPIGEEPRVGRAIAVEQPRLVEQQMRRILLEGAIALAERRERDDELMPRIDFEDRLRRRGQPSGAGENFFQRAVGPGIGRHQTDRAIGEPVRRPAHPRPPRRAPLARKQENSLTASAPPAACCLRPASSRGMSARSAAPCVTDLNGLPSNEMPGMTQNVSTGSGNSSTSTPRARKPSRCGDDFSRAMSSPAR